MSNKTNCFETFHVDYRTAKAHEKRASIMYIYVQTFAVQLEKATQSGETAVEHRAKESQREHQLNKKHSHLNWPQKANPS